MGATTGIAWCDATWNPVTGCTKVSAGCKHCYAAAMAGREIGDFRKVTRRINDIDVVEHRDFGEVRCHPDRLSIPLHWRKPRRIFTVSMGDLWHPAVPSSFRRQVFSVMQECPRHTFQTLTKRPKLMLEEMDGTFHLQFAYMPNWWAGVSVEDQATADARISLLLQMPAAVRFVSIEPMLGPVNLQDDFWPIDPIRKYLSLPGSRCLNWVIVGGESGPQARPCDLAWIRSVVGQCKAAGVPCFVKQLGAHSVRVDEHDDIRGSVTKRILWQHRSGADPSEWPECLRVREFPR